MLKAICIQKIILLACLFLEITMKKTLKLGFGIQPEHNSNVRELKGGPRFPIAHAVRSGLAPSTKFDPR